MGRRRIAAVIVGPRRSRGIMRRVTVSQRTGPVRSVKMIVGWSLVDRGIRGSCRRSGVAASTRPLLCAVVVGAAVGFII
jgi:hypothetical protein